MLVFKIAFRNIFRNKRRSFFTSLTMVISAILASLTISVQDGSYDTIINRFTKNSTGDVQLHAGDYLDSPSIYKTIPESLNLETKLSKIKKVHSIIPKIQGSGLAFSQNSPIPITITGIPIEKTKQETSFHTTLVKGSYFTLEKQDNTVKKENKKVQTNKETNQETNKKNALGQDLKEMEAIKGNIEGDIEGFEENFEDDFEESNDTKDILYEVIINKNMAKKLEVKPLDTIYIISQGADGSTANNAFKVVGITSKNNAGLQQHAFIPLKTAQDFFSLQGRVHEYAITTSSFKYARTLSKTINNYLKKNDAFKEVSAQPWQVIQKDFYKLMKSDKEGSNVLFFIIILIVAIGVLNTVLMSILERRREFGVLKAIGTRKGFIFKMIVLESFILSILSIIIASILFSMINIYFVYYGIDLGANAVSLGEFKMDRLKGVYNLKEYLIPAITILISSVFISLYPAFKVSKSKPIDSLRSY